MKHQEWKIMFFLLIFIPATIAQIVWLIPAVILKCFMPAKIRIFAPWAWMANILSSGKRNKKKKASKSEVSEIL